MSYTPADLIRALLAGFIGFVLMTANSLTYQSIITIWSAL